MTATTVYKALRLSAFLLALSSIGLAGRQPHPASSARASSSRATESRPSAPEPHDRSYGWQRLQAVLAQGGQQETWQKWTTKCDLAHDIVHAAGEDSAINLYGECVSKRKHSGPGTLSRAATDSPQDQREYRHLASVYFNSEAAHSVLRNKLSLPKLPSRPDPLRPHPGAKEAIPDFAPNSTFVKAIWEIVNNEGSDTKPRWPLRVYDRGQIQWQTGPAGQTSTQLLPVVGNVPSSDPHWKTDVLIDPGDKPCPFGKGEKPKDIELEPVSPPATNRTPLSAPVPINCFIHEAVSDDTLGAATVRAIGHSISSNYYMVLVGLHIAVREPSGWTWTTLWWTNHPSVDQAHFAGQETILGTLPVQYSHFAMDTSVAASGPLFNPYQEGPQAPGATLSTCAGCHQYAALRLAPRTGKPVDTDAGVGLGLSGKPPAEVYLKGARTTDFIWSIATARNSYGTPLLSFHATRLRREEQPRK